MANEEVWYAVFGPGHPDLLKQQRLHKRLPSPPRCKLCLAPFGGLGGMVMRFRGKRPSNRNPRFCSACDHFIRAHPGGAEVMLSMVFADVRGSTSLAEQVSPTELHRRLNAFYAAVTHELVETDGFMIDVVGDEVVGVYPPGMSGEHHASLAIDAARRLVALDPERAGGLAFGVGVHTGLVHIGTTMGADEGIADVRAIGDNVNVAARLSSAAAPGEALVSAAAWEAAGETPEGLEQRELQLKGRTEPLRVSVLRSPAHDVAETAAAAAVS
ncbi:MAG TPA: adenylate/guanylate cyclase domain-containing protein [Gaiella sp.]|jgi:adenylate cyclase|nr:adenylate/guanylate cyclase domain-containing protein [Gaiella sp.]